MRKIATLTIVVLVCLVASAKEPKKKVVNKDNFVTVNDGHFYRDGKPYYYVGTNFWYGAILGSEGQGGNRQRLCRCWWRQRSADSRSGPSRR